MSKLFLFVNGKFFSVVIDDGRISRLEESADNLFRDERFNRVRNKSLERTRAVNGIVTALDDIILCRFGYGERNIFLGKSLRKSFKEQIDNLAYFLSRERLVEYYLVESV